jgi:hypothetical protein
MVATKSARRGTTQSRTRRSLGQLLPQERKLPIYLTVPFNHFAVIQKWANETGAEAIVDMRDFTMEVKHRGRCYRMYPMFRGKVQDRIVHLPNLTPDVRGFGGWRPYPTLTHPLSNDKLLFKAYLRECGLRAPQAWPFAGQPPSEDYVLKACNGSFGRGIFGPHRKGTIPSLGEQDTAPYGEMFAEQFVQGRMLKVWFWGAKPFFAHIQDYPAIVGDGRSTVREMLQRRIVGARLQWDSFEQKPIVLACIAFQGLCLEDILAEGRSAWIDYRYAQLYEGPAGGTSVSDNQLEPLTELSGDQTRRLGEALAGLLKQTLPAPVMVTVDGLLDSDGRIWWLEMNTNSLMPPEGYGVMFADLFG